MSEDQVLILFIVMLCAATALLCAAVSIKPDKNKIKKGHQAVKEKCETFNYLGTVSDSADMEALIRSALAYLDKGSWETASDYCSKVLELDSEHTMAYIIKLLADMKLKSIYDISETGIDLSGNVYFRNAVRYADDELRKTLKQLNTRSVYNGGIKKMENAFTAEEYTKAAAIFHSLEKFEDAPQKREYCLDLAAKRRKQELKLLKKDTKLLAGIVIAVGVVAIAVIISVYDPFFEIAENITASDVKKANYEKAMEKYENGDYLEAAYAFRKLNGFKDSEEYEKKANDNYYSNTNISDWTDIAAVSSGENFTVGLKTDETVVAVGAYPKDISNWTNIVAISAGKNDAAGLRSDGTVVVSNDYYDISDWTNIGVPENETE